MYIRFILLLACLASLPATALADDDWVLTDRYKMQLKQAQGGDALAMYEVGRMYERGRGIDQDMSKAAEWYKKASDKGQQEARARLGILYLEGLGVERNVNKAAELLLSAAKAGVSSAQYYLAAMYEQGDGMPRDEQQAIQWYKAAADGGYYQARARIAALSGKPAAAPRKPAAAAVKEPKPAAVTAAAPASSPASAPVAAAQNVPTKEKPGEALMQAILAGNWVNKNEPASFLPSRTTICESTGELQLKCISGELLRSAGGMTISYVLEASLSGFNASDQFKVEYVNNVLGTKQAQQTAAIEGSGPPLAFNVKTGRQSTVHKLNCELEEENKLVCVKDRITTITFTR